MASQESQGPFESGSPSAGRNLQQELSDALEPDERILWSGFPRQGVVLRAQDAFMIPFSLVWCGLIFSSFYSSVQRPQPHFPLDLVMLLFVAIGFYMLVGRFFFEAAIRSRTIYGLTNQRVLILSGWWSRSIRSLELMGLSEINISEKSNGSGTITFGSTGYYGAWGRGWPGNNRYASPAFEGIPQARQVLKMIRDAQKALGRPGS